jgi:three-Cys-motif partner protein
MSKKGFFDETTDQSQVKAEIVQKYFFTWAGIITATQSRHRPGAENRIGYVDLFAGPGRYKDGAASTPLRVLQQAIENPIYAERLVTIFNDKDEAHARSLEQSIQALPGIERLKHKPEIWNEEVGDQIAQQFESIRTIPLLAFVDPWGYKGLTLRLVNAFLKDWGCDCIFFFNYSRINAGLSNPFVHEHMCALFGPERAAALRDQLEPLSPADREAIIVNELGTALQAYGHRFVLPFCFKNESGRRTTHHLILVTKHFKGYEVMKEIMAKSSSETNQGVPSFIYLPPTANQQRLLFELSRPLDDLKGQLLVAFAGRTRSMREIYEEHSVDRPFLARNYKAVLSAMLEEGLIRVDRPPKRQGTFADGIRVTFPLARAHPKA